MEIEQGTFTLETWDDFEKDIMLHFYPKNAKRRKRRPKGKQEWGPTIGLNALQVKGAQPQVQAKGVINVVNMVNGKTTRCLVDTGASHNFMSVQEAKETWVSSLEGSRQYEDGEFNCQAH
ncbi:hypothetical protein L3X38_035999 [Prunus dulcis]|uniref:Uncharacterized protein n=1 Tax=Prunus dulcis TaxID=3755 RepID=A0AAD4V2S5_PRUDU|nr:hypothetical protein L3X38_035999 [Prunus dulcis]